MKMLTKIAIAVAVVGFLAAAVPQAEAACGGNPLLDTQGAYIVANPDWQGAGGPGTCTYLGCYDSESGPPVSPGITGVFWALGSGNPTVGVGDDSGAFTGGADPTDGWIKTSSALFYGNLYHYPAFATLKNGYGSYAGNPFSWNSAAVIDGCFLNNADGRTTCTCVLLNDQIGDVGYFAMISGRPNFDTLNFDLTVPGNVVQMAPIPGAVIQGSSVIDAPQAILGLTVAASAAGGNNGFYQKDGCDCLPSFLVYGNVVPQGGQPPTDRTAGWTPLAAFDGTPQLPTALGGSANVRVDCDENSGGQDLYLAIGLTGGDGFGTGMVSGNSTRVDCTGTLADPGRPNRGPHDRKSDPRPDRGRDGDRQGN